MVKPGAFESPPSKEQPGFSVVCAPVLCDSVSYVEDHMPIDLYIRNILPFRIRLPRRRSWPYRGGAMRLIPGPIGREVEGPETDTQSLGTLRTLLYSKPSSGFTGANIEGTPDVGLCGLHP